MFEVGKVFKVRVETEPGKAALGHATVIEKAGGQLCIQIKSSKSTPIMLPQGSKIWFVSDSSDSTYNGLWASTITATRKSNMLCSVPKLEPPMARRRAPRVDISLPVRMTSAKGTPIGSDIRSRDISRSGIGLEASGAFPESLDEEVKIVIETSAGEIEAACKVIRIDRNWLANKTLIGLEFTQLEPEVIGKIDKVLILLGGKPRVAQSDHESGQPDKPKGLSEWMSASRTNMPALKPNQMLTQPQDESDPEQTGLAGWASASRSKIPTLDKRFIGGAKSAEDDAAVDSDSTEPEKKSEETDDR